MPGIIENNSTVIDGKTVPVAAIPDIDYGRLLSGDKAEIDRLVDAAGTSGWFFLDLQTSDAGKAILADVPKVYESAETYFDQPEELKKKDVRLDQEPSQDRGFKTSSCDETFEMSRDEVKSGKLQWPSAMKGDAETIKRFSDGCHSACETVLSTLSEALNFDKEQHFALHHRAGHTSDSGLKLIYEPSLAKLADVGDNLHTDSGTMTFLFYDKWGLSAHMPSQGFAFTEPKDGYALINVADSLQRLSGNKLHSPQHRVSQPVDGADKRYYLSYFLRPEHELQKQWVEAN